MWVINNRKLFYGISGILIIASAIALFIWGLKPGIDFTGGTLIEVSYNSGTNISASITASSTRQSSSTPVVPVISGGVSRPSQSDLASKLSAIDPSASIRPSGSDSYIVRMKPINQAEKNNVLSVLGGEVKTFDSIGPILGSEALRKAYVSVLLVIIGIVLFITFAFRKVSEPVSSWKYGLVAIVALIHDVIIPVGAYSFLGHFAGYEVDTLFVTAVLVVLGFSVHDTIVVFDRVRENLKLSSANKPFSDVVGESISQTFTRSINTSLTTLLALIVLYIFGGSVTQHFALTLVIGIAAGTYSSIFIGSPLLVSIASLRKGKDKR